MANDEEQKRVDKAYVGERDEAFGLVEGYKRERDEARKTLAIVGDAARAELAEARSQLDGLAASVALTRRERDEAIDERNEASRERDEARALLDRIPRDEARTMYQAALGRRVAARAAWRAAQNAERDAADAAAEAKRELGLAEDDLLRLPGPWCAVLPLPARRPSR